jgi:hypothetical protein
MARIKLARDYRGKKTNNQVIRAGEYDRDDDALFGQADYLLENGHAVEVDSETTTSSNRQNVAIPADSGPIAAPVDPTLDELVAKGYLTRDQVAEIRGQNIPVGYVKPKNSSYIPPAPKPADPLVFNAQGADNPEYENPLPEGGSRSREAVVTEIVSVDDEAIAQETKHS